MGQPEGPCVEALEKLEDAICQVSEVATGLKTLSAFMEVADLGTLPADVTDNEVWGGIRVLIRRLGAYAEEAASTLDGVMAGARGRDRGRCEPLRGPRTGDG